MFDALMDKLDEQEKRIKELEQINEEHREINGELHSRINKAKEYINEKTKEISFDNDRLIDVLNILKGEDK